jgi:hypothetical protein
VLYNTTWMLDHLYCQAGAAEVSSSELMLNMMMVTSFSSTLLPASVLSIYRISLVTFGLSLVEEP